MRETRDRREEEDSGRREVSRKRDSSGKKKGGRGEETADDDGKVYRAILRDETAALSRAATCLRRLRAATLRNFR